MTVPTIRTAMGVVLVAAICPALTGCGALDQALKLRKPSAEIVGVSLKDIGLESATMLFDVEVSNPYSLALPLVNVDYGLASEGEQFLTGEAPMEGTVPANGKRTISLPAKVSYVELLKALKKVRPGQVVPYKAAMGLSVDAPGVGPLRLPVNKSGSLPVPAAPEVKVSNIKWDELSLSKAGGVVTLDFINRNSFPVDLGKLRYALSLGKTEVARSSLAKAVHFDADGGAGALEIPISFSPKDLGLAVLGMLRGAEADYSFAGTMDAQTPFGPMSIALSKVGKTSLSR